MRRPTRLTYHRLRRRPLPFPSPDITHPPTSHSAYPKHGLVGVQTVAKFRSPDAPSLPVRVYLVNIRYARLLYATRA